MEGLEPSSLVRAADFESAAVASFATSPAHCAPKIRRIGSRVKDPVGSNSLSSMSVSLHSLRFLSVVAVSMVFASACEAQNREPSLPEETSIVHPAASAPDSIYLLPHLFVAAGTESLRLDSTVVLRSDSEYVLFPGHGSVKFTPKFWDLVRARGLRSVEVSVRFRYYPFSFRDFYTRHRMIVLRDSSDTSRLARPPSTLNLEDIFGSNLQKSGSIFRGFTVGTNRDLSLSSGLRMQLSGKLTQDIDVAAVLTDENTPIQPEGTTQTLQEFDKVFVDIRGRDLSATLGDFVLDVGGTEFANLSRKLQGAKGDAEYRFGFSQGSVLAAGAVTRGKFNTMQFNGVEGVQGPYLLTGKYQERSIIVVAGTEKVYVDGELMVRGESNDYTIDYSLGEVTFSTRRLITSASRITIDFEYSDRQFSRSLLGGQTKSSFLDDRAHLTFTFFREADDPGAPIDLNLTDSVRNVIASAGADRDRAVLSGATRVDSNGFYIQVDTVLAGGVAERFYRYAPGDPDAHYNVTFSQVGAGKGEYSRRQIGIYDWHGPGGGDYVPLQYLPLPQSQQMMDVLMDITPVNQVHLTGEFAGTTLDPNRLSYTNVKQDGHGINMGLQWNPSALMIGGTNFGKLDLAIRERYTSEAFNPLDRTTDIEYGRKWGIDSLVQTSEEVREGSLSYSPDSTISLGGNIGTNTRGNGFHSVRDAGSISLRLPSAAKADYTLESIRSTDAENGTRSSWLRQKGDVERSLLGFLVPHVTYEAERRIYSSDSLDTAPGSFAFDDIGAGVTVKALGPLSASMDFGWRNDDFALNGQLLRESRAITKTFGVKLSEWHNISDQIDVAIRNRAFTPAFQSGNPDVRSVLVRNQTRFSPLNRGLESDLVYEVSTERASKLERVYIRVAVGTGTYKYLGDLNKNGIADDDEFVPARFDGDYIAVTVPSDNLIPVINLRSGLRIRTSPARFVHEPGALGDILRALSAETYVRVDEKSTERDLAQIYLLHFNSFRRDSTTLDGSRLFSQDLFILDGNPVFSARFRFNDRQGLTNLSGGLERTYTRERSVRLRWQLIPEISNEFDFTNTVNSLSASITSDRVRAITGNEYSLDIAYRPEQDVEIGFKLDGGRSIDEYPTVPVQADLNTESIRGVISFRGAGQARVEIGREEVLLSRIPETFPYELTGGRVDGLTWTWTAALDYRITQFLQATLNYDGRIEGGSSPVHTARAEVRAFF